MAKRFEYEYKGNKIEAIFGENVSLLVVNGVVHYEPHSENYKGGVNGTLRKYLPTIDTLPTGEKIVLKINTKPTIGEYVMNEKWDVRDSTTCELTVNGVELKPINRPIPRSREILQKIADNYEKIGRLSEREFLAVKSLSKPITTLQHGYDLESQIIFQTTRTYSPFERILNSQLVDHPNKEFGFFDLHNVIKPGDSVKFSGHERIDVDGKKKSNYVNVTLDNVTGSFTWPELIEKQPVIDRIFNESPVKTQYVIENGQQCITSVDFSEEQSQLYAVLSQPGCKFTKEFLTSVIGEDTSLEEYVMIRELKDLNIEITDQILDDLSYGMELREVFNRACNEEHSQVIGNSQENIGSSQSIDEEINLGNR